MIPSALVAQLEQGLRDFLLSSFSSTTAGFDTAIQRLLDEQGRLVKGPFVQVALPFVRGSKPDWFPKVPLPFTPHKHQELAFARLGGAIRRSTLIATGTGSGKSESFLWPILAHCEANAAEPGIKAILIYPMNALASDQALRIARAIDGNSNLRGKVRAGLYIGDDGEGKAHGAMGPDHLITDRSVLKQQPPDILLTNYKMFDYLMVRPRDRHLWRGSTTGSVRFLVVDELHTFDGAQGTDLACLIRRLKARLHVEPGQLCCVGTSATLGGPEAGEELRAYAAQVFGEPFDGNAIVGEVRQTEAEYFRDALITEFRSPGPEHKDVLAPGSYDSPDAYLVAQARLWVGDASLDGAPGSDVWKVSLGARLREHAMLRNVLARVSGAPRDLSELVGDLARAVPAYRDDPELGRRALTSFLALVSVARAWREELPAAMAARVAQGKPRPTDAFLQVRVQLWQRELRRMVASIGAEPRLRFFDDLNANDQRSHLPVIYCRDCGAMGWATLRRAEDPWNLRVDLRTFYSAFFAGHPSVRFLFPVERGGERKQLWNERRVHVRSLQATDGAPPDSDDFCAVWEITQVRNGELHRDCPFCNARSTLALVGFQAATLTSAFIDQLFSSPWNADKKLLAFSDSVQDAAHRAGFFAARTWRFNIRVALARFLLERGTCSLSELASEFPRSLHDDSPTSIANFVGMFIPHNLEWMRDYETLRNVGTIPAGSNLPGHVERRLAWEVFEEFGLRSRLGRSFVRSGFASVAVRPRLFAEAVDALHETLSQQVGWLRDVRHAELQQFLAGFLHHLRERGGILHGLFPQQFIDTAGKTAFMFMKTPYLPDMSTLSRLPVLLADREEGHFDHPGQSYTWYARWAQRTLGETRPLFEPQVVFALALDVLTRLGILARADTKQPAGHCWGLAPDAIQVAASTMRVACDRCGHAATVPTFDDYNWGDMICLSARCSGAMRRVEFAGPDYFAALYAHGEVARIVAAEHTGLLQRGEREQVEAQFKRTAGRQPWDPNLLSCTPTLEMGIDIGDLSSVMLCSVPPAQANYLQRIGRAGRRDGNSLVVTLANAHNHDLYFFEDPAEMMAGEIRPPGLYLDASAVLERQLTAWCFDRWAEQNDNDHALPRTLREIYSRLDDDDTSQRFPHDLRDFISTHRAELFEGFKAQFAASLQPASLTQLQVFLEGDDQNKAGLVWEIYRKLHEQREQSEDYRRQIRRISDRIKAEETQPLDDVRAKLLEELRRELSALAALRGQFDGRDTLEFFTDEGLLPNYAFPEAAVRLRSVIWRKKEKDGEGYETFTYKYERPGEAALSELAPDPKAKFYAGGRGVTIERVDLQGSGVEPWRFCDQCDYAAREIMGEMGNVCPTCGSPVWADTGRVLQLVQLRQVFAASSDRDSRIGDERDDRVSLGYLRDTQVTFKPDARAGAWVLGQGSEPFGWEYLSRASFREINYGKREPTGTRLTVAGRSEIRSGFNICKECGQLQPGATAKHAPSCKARNPVAPGNFIECVYLYRAFDSEAVRILLPVVDFASNREVQSLVAGIRTGLRLYFGGRVDHLRMTLENEPVKDSTLRRQYLVLYDSIPGGSGYLAQLVRDPNNFFALLERAHQHLVECGCGNELGRDGCYRCVFQYRTSYEMDDISRATAISLLSSILGRRGELEEVQSLSDVSVKGLVDSALEKKFLAVLHRAGTDARPSTLTPAFVKNKPGWRWQIGDRTWMIEPQRDHAPNDGFGVGISMDFVFHPGDGVPTGEPTFAVFLDGWQYHADRVAFDMLQRMSAKASGRYVVWSFTWDDVARALGEGDAADVALLLPAAHAKVAPLAAQWKLGVPPSDILDRTSLSLFVERLAGGVDARKLRVLAGALLLAPLQPVFDTTLSDALEVAAPDTLRAQLSVTGEALCHIEAGDESFPGGRVVVVPKAAVAAEFAAIGEGKRLSALRAVFTLGTSPDDASRRRAWAAMLRTSNLLSELPGTLLFVARPGSDTLDFQALADLAGPQRPTSSPWDRVRAEVAASFRAMVDQLAAVVNEVPEVGIDLPDERGRAGELQAELAWERCQVAVLEDESREGAESRVAVGWRLFSPAELATSLTPLLDALRERGGTLR